MLRKTVQLIWPIIPPVWRRRIVRSTQTTFTVSVGAVILDDNNHVLLLNHLLRPSFGWGLAGGFIEAGEQPEPALRRELKEEIGLEVTDLQFFSIRTVYRHVEILYVTRTNQTEFELQTTEITEAKWFEADNLPTEMTQTQKNIIHQVFKELNLIKKK